MNEKHFRESQKSIFGHKFILHLKNQLKTFNFLVTEAPHSFTRKKKKQQEDDKRLHLWICDKKKSQRLQSTHII